VLLLDLLMPDLSGVEVIDALKNDVGTRDIPILLVTAAELSDEDHRRLNRDVQAILAKGATDTASLLGEIGRATGRMK